MTVVTADHRRPEAGPGTRPRRLAAFRKLKARLLLIVLVAVVPVFGAQVYYEIELRATRRADAGAQVTQMAALVAAQLDRLVEGAETVLVTLGEYPSVRFRQTAVCNETLIRLVARFPHLDGIGAATPDGEIFCSSRADAVPFSVAERPYFHEVLRRKSLVISTIVPGQLTGRSVIALAQPTLAEKGEVESVLVLSLDPEVLSLMLAEIGLPEGAVIGVVDAQGRRLARVPYAPELIGDPPPEPLLTTVLHGGSDVPLTSQAEDGIARFYGVARSNEARDLVVYAGLPREPFFSAADRLFLRQVGISALAFLAAGLVAYRFGSYAVSRPIGQLRQAMQRVAGGDFSARAGFDSGIEELSELGASFDQMARRRRRAEEQHELLLRELNHRIKNTVAAIRSIAMQTLRHSASLEEFQTAFEGRIAALGRTSTLLATREAQAVDLRGFIQAALEPWRSGGNLVLSGPVVAMPAEAALPVSLTLHELATNAAKYGALSVPEGRVEITWRREVGPGRPELVIIDWRERGGPPVRPPDRHGFGRTLIEHFVAHELEGAAELDFAPDGVCCQIRLPVGERRGGPGAGKASSE